MYRVGGYANIIIVRVIVTRQQTDFNLYYNFVIITMYSLKSRVKIKYAERVQGLREIRLPERGELTVKQCVRDVWRIAVADGTVKRIYFRLDQLSHLENKFRAKKKKEYIE